MAVKRRRRLSTGPGGRERQAPTKAKKHVSAGGRERQKPTRRKPSKNLGREGQGRNVGGSRARSGDPELRGR